MPRNRTYLAESKVIVHVWNEGVRREQIFRSSEHYELFLRLLLLASTLTGVTILLYTLTPFRFDLVLLQHKPCTLSDFMKYLCNNYSRLINQQLNRRGHSFLKRYSGQPVHDAGEFLILSYDLHMNAVSEQLASTPHAWPYTSCPGYLDSKGGSLVDHSLVWELVGGREKYKGLLEMFKRTDPGSIQDFLCPESSAIWDNKRGNRRRQKR
jgi:putative transposase